MCDNGCSGHGSCDCGQCQCYDNWGIGNSHEPGDCSDRICPFELSWIDVPDINGVRHRYMECAGRGICDRVSGECQCFDGYEGKGCQRTTCPNDCSGHGRCRYIEDFAYGAVEFDYQHFEFKQELLKFYYFGWDESKVRGCVCDPGYTEYDCSKRICPHGNDVMSYRDDLTIALRYQTQRIRFTANTDSGDDLDDLEGKTFALTFKSILNETFTTHPIYFNANDLDGMQIAVENQLKKLPNEVIESVNVAVSKDGTPGTELIITIQFDGDYNQGKQHLITVEDYYCGEGCFPRMTGIDLKPLTGNVTETIEADYNSYECGRRGKCDYETGLCKCFEGYTGASCNTLTALR